MEEGIRGGGARKPPGGELEENDKTGFMLDTHVATPQRGWKGARTPGGGTGESWRQVHWSSVWEGGGRNATSEKGLGASDGDSGEAPAHAGVGRGAGSRLFLRGPLQKEYSAGPQWLGLQQAPDQQGQDN